MSCSKHFSSKKLRVKWKFSWKILFLKKFESEMKVFLYAYIECIPWGNEVGFIALTGHQTYASFSAHLYSTGREMFCVQLFQVFVSRYIMILLFYDTLNLSDKK